MLEWLILIVPLVFGFETRAVITTVHTGFQDEEHGIAHAIPALASTWLVYLAYAVVIGFTYGWLLLTFPVLLSIAKYIAIVLMLGMAFMIWSRDKDVATENYLPLNEELLVKIITPAIPLIMLFMYSLFLDVTRPLGLQVIAMTIGVVAMSFITQLVWVVAGFVLDNDFFSTESVARIDKVLAGLFVLLAVLVVLFFVI